MTFVLIVKLRLSRPFAHWAARFDEHRDVRAAEGISDLFRYPVIGGQAAIYGVRTAMPRRVHDMIYNPDVRDHIEESGFVIGSEEITVCEADA